MNNVDRAEAFRTRLKECMNAKHYSQSSLANCLNQNYAGKYTYNDVRRWLHTGLDTATPSMKNKGGHIAFPKMETIIHLAALFEVDIGYLLGETDMSTYTIAEVCQYTGLTEAAMNSLTSVTGAGHHCIAFGHESQEYQRILSAFLSSKAFMDFAYGLRDLDAALSDLYKERERVRTDIGDEQYAEAYKMYTCDIDYLQDPNAPQLSDAQIAAIRAIDESIDAQQDITYRVKIARYELHNLYETLIHSIFPTDYSEVGPGSTQENKRSNANNHATPSHV